VSLATAFAVRDSLPARPSSSSVFRLSLRARSDERIPAAGIVKTAVNIRIVGASPT